MSKYKSTQMIDDLTVVNSPESDVIGLAIAGFKIVVERDEKGEVTVDIHDQGEGGETLYILGEEGYTQRV